MTAAVLAGLVAGFGIAIPVGAIAPLLVSVTARTSWRVGVAAALGVASADGVYAFVAALAGAGAARVLTPYAGPLRWASAVVLAVLAVRTAWTAVRAHRSGGPPSKAPAGSRSLSTPARAYAGFLALTVINPATVAYFAALIAGGAGDGSAGPAGRLAFAAAAFAASASWQLLLAAGGVVVGRTLTGPAGRLTTGIASSVLILGLAVAIPFTV